MSISFPVVDIISSQIYCDYLEENQNINFCLREELNKEFEEKYILSISDNDEEDGDGDGYGYVDGDGNGNGDGFYYGYGYGFYYVDGDENDE